MLDHEWWRSFFAECHASDYGFTKRAHIASNNQGFVLEEGHTQHVMFRLTDKPSSDVKFKIYGLISDFPNGAPCGQTIYSEFIDCLVDNGIQSISAELESLGESGRLTDHRRIVGIKIRNWFQLMDHKYFNSIDDDFAAFYLQREEALADMTPQNAQRLAEITKNVSGGASAAIALRICDRLYVANCGNVRALLISQDPQTRIGRVECLTQLHQTDNREELLRLVNLGLTQEQTSFIKTPTRCFGNFFMKGGYRDNSRFSLASSEPCTVEPHISGGFKIDASHRFIVLASDSVFKVILQSGIHVNDVNDYLIEKIATAYNGQYSSCDVTQSVLDEICADHSAYQLQVSVDPIKQRESMALLCVCLHEGYQEQLVLNRIREAPVIPSTAKRDTSQMVQSYVDFSSFINHPRSEIVTMKVDQVFEQLRAQRRLRKIEEDE